MHVDSADAATATLDPERYDVATCQRATTQGPSPMQMHTGIAIDACDHVPVRFTDIYSISSA